MAKLLLRMAEMLRLNWARFQRLDPRIPVAVILFTYLVLGLTVLGFNRSPTQVLITTSTCCLLELVLTRIFVRKWQFPLSAMITSFSLSFLLNYSHSSWMIVLPPLLAIGSKFVLRWNGRHFFNPALFGVSSSLLLSQELITAAPAYQWNGIASMSLFIVMLGLMFVIPKVNRHWLVLSYLIMFTLTTALRAFIMRHHLPFETLFFGTLSSPSFFIFTFFMITDPATSPGTKKDQIWVGVAIALVDLVLHLRQSYYTFFYAALIVASSRFVYFHARRLWNDGMIPVILRDGWKSGYWRQPALVSLIVVAGVWAYSKLLHPSFASVLHPLRFERLDAVRTGLDADREGDLLSKVDPRVQKIAKWLLAETEGAAAADYDGDGRVDLFLCQPLKGSTERAMLYRNVGGHRFEKAPITVLQPLIAKPEVHGIITNAIFADYDNDGDQDLFLTVVHGHSILLKNLLKERGRVEWVDVSEEAGLSALGTQSISATFADFNRDGLLDLFIANALEEFLPDYPNPPRLNLFRLPQPEYPGDRRMFNFMHASWNLADNGGSNRMLLQTPGHRFELQDPQEWGGAQTRWSLAVGAADLNRDGWPDLYVANDFGPDELYYNREGKGFELIEGRVFGSMGKDTYKGMNVSIADFDRAGWLGVYVSNVHHALQAEGSLLWSFSPGTEPRYPRWVETATQKGALNEGRFGWGAAAADFDNDGWVDLAQANGMVDDRYDRKFEKCPDYWYVNEKIARSPPSYHRFADTWADIRGYCIFGQERNRLYVNRGPSTKPQFVDIASSSGLIEETNSRGVVTADFENLGRRDLLFTHPFSQPTFYRNALGADPGMRPRAWVGLVLEGNGTSCNRDAIGTRIELHATRADGSSFVQTAEVQAVTGLLAQGDRRVHFGLGSNVLRLQARIHWCGSSKEEVVDLAAGSYHRRRQQQ